MDQKENDQELELETPPIIPSEDDSQELLDSVNEVDMELLEKEDWKEVTGLTEEVLPAALESLIFVSERPISINKLRDAIHKDIPLSEVHAALTLLQGKYEEPIHGIRLQEVAEGYQFRTKQTYSHFIQNLYSVPSLSLSPTALEVLAIVAYRQPVSRADIDKIRGVDSSHILRALMDKRLVKMGGRSNDPGRPSTYETAPEFLELFNLSSIEELPPEYELENLIEQNQMGEISDIKELVNGVEKPDFFFDEIDEIDQLKETIKEVETETGFTKLLKGPKDGPVPSAFDLMEDFIKKDEVVQQNNMAKESSPLIESGVGEVIHDLLSGPHNAPEDIDEDPLHEQQAEELESEDANEQFEALFEEDTAEEKEKLSQALDDAFDSLMNDKEDQGELDLSEDFDGVDAQQADMDASTEQIAEKAKELDLDLGFLQENQEKSSEDTLN